MKILGIHADVTHLGGHTRAFLMFMDCFKSMGYNVHVVARTKKQCIAKVDIPIMDEKSKLVLVPSEVKATCNVSQHSIKALRKFQPVKYLSPSDISMHDIPVVYWGDHFLTPWAPEVVAMMEEADYVFCDTEMYIRMETELSISHKHINFVHFPTVNLMPVYKREPKRIWANSTFTQSWIRIMWGYNNLDYTELGDEYAVVKIPKQIFNAEVVYPPIYVDDYKSNRGFSDRPYDVVMFARLGEDKFTVTDYLNSHFKLLCMGARIPITKKGEKVFIPKGELHKNVTFKQIPELLSQAKVYIHSKGFGRMPITGGESLPEHFGLTVCEAMASGCPTIVPRAGGCWTDISLYGKYALGYSSLEELKVNVETLIHKKDEWEKWHNLALEGVKRFDVENTKQRIKELLD